MVDTVRSLDFVPVWRSSLSHPQDLEQVFARYMDPLYRFIYARVGNREDAEDLASEVFLKASRQLDLAREDAGIAQWLFTVARTVLADHWRRYYRTAPTVPLEEELIPEAEQKSARQAGEQRVADVLAVLPERSRTVLELRFLRGYSVAETAQELGLTPDNVKVIQHRALAKVAQLQMEAG